MQGENRSHTIIFAIPNETMEVSGSEVILKDCYFYLLYKRKGDAVPQIPLLLTKTYDSTTDIISASFEPTSYFTEKEGALEVQVFACSTEESFITGDVDIEDIALWTTFASQISISKSQLKNSQTIVAEDMFTKGIAEMSAYLESGSEEADAAEEFASDAEEFAKGTRSDGETVPHASTSSTDNAKAYKNLAKDWASKIGGAVESGEYSAKYYAIVSDTRSQESEAYALGTKGGTPVPSFADKNAKDWATKTGSKVDANNYSAKQYALNADASATSAAASAAIVSAHATAIEAIGADLENIDAVAGDLTNIDAVKSNQANIDAVADNETNINAVNSNKTNIDTVAGISSNVTTVAGKASDVSTVAGIASNVTVVAGKASEVTTVAGVSSDVTTVAGISSAVSTVATNASAVSNVSTNMSDVNDVADDLTKITAVADDLTNIDAVADDLTNIDNAVNYALEAEGFAVGEQNGVPVTSGSPYYQNNAKYYSQEVPALKNALEDSEQRIENLEQAVSGSLVTTNVLTDPPSMANVRTITSANTILPWALLNRVGARAVAWNQLVDPSPHTVNGVTVTFSNGKYSFNGTASSSGGRLTIQNNGGIRITQGHKYLFYISSPTTQLDSWNLSNDSTLANVLATKSTIIYTAESSYTAILGCNVLANTAYNFSETILFFDLTAMNEASLTADQFRAKFPASYYPYNAGEIIDTNPSAFKVVGKNKIDASTFERKDTDGNLDTNWATWTSHIPYIEGASYTFSCKGIAFTQIWYLSLQLYSVDGTRVGEIKAPYGTFDGNGSYTFTLSGFSSASYGRIYMYDTRLANASPYEPQMEIGTTATTYASYSASTLDTSFTSDYKYVNENCHDYSENVLVDGQKMREEHKVVGSYTFTGNETVYGGANGNFNTPVLDGIGKFPSSSSVKANIVFEGYVTLTASKVNDMDSPMSVGAYQDTVTFYNPSITSTAEAKAELAGKTIYFELATPNAPTLHNDPIPNFPSEDGTTITAITPQTELVNAIDVPNTIAYMTKISS